MIYYVIVSYCIYFIIPEYIILYLWKLFITNYDVFSLSATNSSRSVLGKLCALSVPGGGHPGGWSLSYCNNSAS